MSPMVRISNRSRIVGLGGLGLVALIYAGIALKIGGADAPILWSDIGEAAIVLASAAFMIWVALRFSPGEALRRQWMLIGIGVALFGVGDAVWAVIEVGMGQEVPYPGLPDIFYVAEYFFLCTGVILAAVAYRRLMDIRGPALLAALLTLVVAIPAYVFVLHPIIVDTEISLGEKVLSTFYPLGDLFLQLLPALLIILVITRLGGGSLGWPWWAVAIGIALWAVSDTTYSYLSANGLYQSGQIVDAGWMAGAVFMALGASIAADIARPALGARQAP